MPGVSTTDLRRIIDIEKKYNRQKDREVMRPFIDELSKILMTLLASTPFDNWPREAKICFLEAVFKNADGAVVYLNNLPLE